MIPKSISKSGVISYLINKWVLWLSMFLVFVGMTSLWPALPFIALQFGASPFELGMFIAVLPLTGWLAALVFGKLSDKYNRKIVLIVVISLAALFHASYYFSTTLSMLVIIRLFHGVGGATLGCVQSLLISSTPEKYRSVGLATLGIMFGLGLIVGASTTAVLISYDLPLSNVSLFGGAIMASGSIILSLFYRYNPKEHKKTQDRKVSIKWGKLKPYIAVFFLLQIGFTGIEGTFALWAKQTFSLHAGNVGVILALSAFSNIIGHGVAGGLSRYLKSKTIALAGMAVIIVGSATLISHYYYSMTYIGMSLLGLGVGLFLPSQQNIIAGIAGNSTGVVMGTNQSLQQVARILGPPLAGYIYQYYHSTAPLMLMCVIAICLLIYSIRRW